MAPASRRTPWSAGACSRLLPTESISSITHRNRRTKKINIPVISGLIRRRILLNYRVAPEVVQGILPEPFRPKLVGGRAIAGICLIRLEQIRPKGLPALLGFSSENSAHRIAVEWKGDDGVAREGVFIPRRDTDSRISALAGGRIFPGVHHLSQFTVSDHDGRIALRVDADDFEEPLVDLELSETDEFPTSSVFESIQAASGFFEAGCIGYSSRPDSCRLDGLLLKVADWQVTPLHVHRAGSAYFDDPTVFSTEGIELDHALLMRNIAHEWHSEPSLKTR